MGTSEDISIIQDHVETQSYLYLSKSCGRPHLLRPYDSR